MQNLLIFLIIIGVIAGVAQLVATSCLWLYRQLMVTVARDKSPVISESDIFEDESKANAEDSVSRKMVNELPARMRKAAPVEPELSAKHLAWAAAMEQHDLDNAFYETLDSPAYLRRGLTF